MYEIHEMYEIYEMYEMYKMYKMYEMYEMYDEDMRKYKTDECLSSDTLDPSKLRHLSIISLALQATAARGAHG